MRTTVIGMLLVLGAGLAVGCDDEPAETAEPAAETAAEGEAAEPEDTAMHAPPADPNEACASVIVVAWQGAQYAGDEVTRTKEQARARAEELKSRIQGGADFAQVARAESDAASTAPRGGLMGTYTRDEWPSVHAPIQDTVFGLGVGELSDVVEAPYGWVLARRCPVEKVHSRHILVRYEGAKNAPEDVGRTKDEARALAAELHAQVVAPNADFAAVARERSEDASAERGGDVGTLGRGRLAPEYEAAAFALQPGEVSAVVETEYGFHIIQRLEG